MKKNIKIRNALLEKGFFPEILPPCFDSKDLTRGFKGLINKVEKEQFSKRSSNYIRYSGTKHDGNRRAYGTANPIPYFNACSFIASHWNTIDEKFKNSSISLGNLRLGEENEDRAIIIPTLSELSQRMSSQISFAPYIIKTDIAQFFPSIYTHTIPWAAHGISTSKQDQKHNSQTNIFNRLDWFTQQCQNSQTRGVLVGPDVFRVIAEFIVSEIDQQLTDKVGNKIIGAIRHVDDFYIGVRTEIDATIVLSELRDTLQTYELQINDSKTKILSGVEPIDDVWAQELRSSFHYSFDVKKINYALDKAHELSKQLGSQSPFKLVLRRLDNMQCYKDNSWKEIESKLQRVMYHNPHCIDYICLLLAKRYAIKGSIDKEGWSGIIGLLINRHISFNHHHEITWLLWITLVCKLDFPQDLLQKLCTVNNSHVKAILIAAYQKGLYETKPSIKLGSNLSTTDETWLHNLVGKATGYTKASFSGLFAQEFEHLASKNIKLINFKKHIVAVSDDNSHAISKSKYGYDSEDDELDFDIPDFDEDDLF